MAILEGSSRRGLKKSSAVKIDGLAKRPFSPQRHRGHREKPF
jgi:hypothetical protein